MNDREGFLARWSRRKRETEDEAKTAAAPEPTEPGSKAEHGAEMGAAPAEADSPPFDVASLPPIESISADTDIRGFLLPGVPAELRQAALRRAWAADPKIRDFVGLADYDWDFNAANSMPGFGPLQTADALRRLAANGLSGGKPPGEQVAGGPGEHAKPDLAADIDDVEARQPGGAAANQSVVAVDSSGDAETGRHPGDSRGEEPAEAPTKNVTENIQITKAHTRRGRGGAVPR